MSKTQVKEVPTENRHWEVEVWYTVQRRVWAQDAEMAKKAVAANLTDLGLSVDTSDMDAYFSEDEDQ